MSIKIYMSLCRLKQPIKVLDKCGLTRTRMSYKTYKFSVINCTRHIVQSSSFKACSCFVYITDFINNY